MMMTVMLLLLMMVVRLRGRLLRAELVAALRLSWRAQLLLARLLVVVVVVLQHLLLLHLLLLLLQLQVVLEVLLQAMVPREVRVPGRGAVTEGVPALMPMLTLLHPPTSSLTACSGLLLEEHQY